MEIRKFEELPLMGIMRGIPPEDIAPLIETVINAGLETIEITMNTPGATDMISEAVSCSGGRINVGAGTVLSTSDMEKALVSGAGFIVMPVLIKDIVIECSRNSVAVFPGAFTPQEVFDAWECGASMVKVFPSSHSGPSYIGQLKGPFDKIKMMAVGGVKLADISDYFDAGASAVAFGGSVFREELIRKKDFLSICEEVSHYVREVKSCC